VQEGKAEPAHGHGGAAGPPANAQPGALSALINGMDPNGISFIKNIEGGFCKDCTVLTAKADVVFENGTRADISSGVYLHHVIFMNLGKSQEPWVSPCPGTGSSTPPPASKSAMPVASFVGGK
jgi:hypothetical protein